MSKLPLNHEKFHKCTLMGESSMGTNDIKQVLIRSFKYTIRLLSCHVEVKLFWKMGRFSPCLIEETEKIICLKKRTACNQSTPWKHVGPHHSREIHAEVASSAPRIH